MTDLLYITMARVHGGGWHIISASTDEEDAQHEADKFREAGYVAKVEKTFVRITDASARRIWRTVQKQLEQQAMNQ